MRSKPRHGVLHQRTHHRFGRFPGRLLFAGLVSAPLVIPEVMSGLSLLLLFVGLEDLVGWPERGMTTIVLGHTTFCLAFVAVIVQSRLTGMDRSALSKLETGQRANPTVETLVRYAEAVGKKLIVSLADA